MLAKNLEHHLSIESKSRRENPLKAAFKFYGQPDLIFLGGGLPHSDYFPWNKITIESPKAPFENGVGYTPKDDSEKTTFDITKTTNDGMSIPLARSLQYGNVQGHPELLSFLKKHTEIIHKVKYENWDILVNTGNTQGWDNVLRTFCNRGDVILVEEYAFSSSLEAANAQGVTTFPITMDDYGIIPEKLEQLLDNWKGENKPRLIYTVPTGQNPTGSCLPNERRLKIYDICCKYDIIIVEDEPYYFLQMEEYIKDVNARKSHETESYDEFINSLVKSFLSIDTEGRVLRLDSFSKTLAPGSRIGWITAQSKFIERLLRLHEVSAQTPSGFSSSIIAGTLNHWGQEGYLDWLMKLRKEYTYKRDLTIDSLYKYFPSEVVSFLPPVAGMFFTFKIKASAHPTLKDPLAIEKAIYDTSEEIGSFMIPGSWFITRGQTDPPQEVPENSDHQEYLFFRGTYAACSSEDVKLGLERFGNGIKKEFGLL